MLSTSELNNPVYPPLMNVLNKFLPKRKIKEKAIYTKRSKISDQHKNLCRVFIQSYFITSTKGTNDSNALHVIQSLLNTTLATNSTSLALGKEKSKIREDTIRTLLSNCEKNQSNCNKTTQVSPSKHTTIINNLCSTNTQHSIKSSSPESPKTIILIDDNSSQESISISNMQTNREREQQKYYLNEALSDTGGLLSSMGVMRAIEVFRNEALSDHFFASAESCSIFNEWSPTEGWERAARIFGSRRVMTMKPSGIYFIPIFDEGHWTLAVIQKIGRFKKAFMIDSLGTSSHQLAVNNKLEELFKVNGGRFEWHTCISVRQQEYECGLRMITSIMRIVAALREGRNFEESIQKATLQGDYVESNEYNPMEIRREAAQVIARYDRTMWTGPIRICVNHNDEREESNAVKKKKKRRRRR